jgi:N-acetylglucosamine-6-phosphate deacetylase
MTWAAGRIFTPSGWVEGRIVSDGERILAVEPGAQDRDQLIVPGFIDLHLHGAGGSDAMDASAQALEGLAATVARHGTTSFLATAITAPREELARVLAAPLPHEGAECIGFHLEGPLVSQEMRGVQPEAAIRAPDADEVEAWLKSGRVRLVTVAPEEPGATRLIQRLTRAGVRVNLGHSAATYEQGAAGLAAGADGFTHLFNAMSGLHHRAPGLVGLALDGPEGFVEIIADGIHLAPAVVRLAFRAAGDRIVLVTDAMRAAGLSDGQYDLGPIRVTVSDGAARDERGHLAGSILTQDVALRRVTDWGVPVEAALAALSVHPARRLGLRDRGRLLPGLRADWVVLDTSLRVRETVVGGKVVHRV